MGSEYLSGVGRLNDRLLILLDLNKVLTLKELESLDKVKELSTKLSSEGSESTIAG